MGAAATTMYLMSAGPRIMPRQLKRGAVGDAVSRALALATDEYLWLHSPIEPGPPAVDTSRQPLGYARDGCIIIPLQLRRPYNGPAAVLKEFGARSP